MLDLGDVLQFLGVCLTAWVAWNLRIVKHQTNSMQDEMQRLAKDEGKAEEQQAQREREGQKGDVG